MAFVNDYNISTIDPKVFNYFLYDNIEYIYGRNLPNSSALKRIWVLHDFRAIRYLCDRKNRNPGSSVAPIYVQYIFQNKNAQNPLTNVSFISLSVLLLTQFLPETFRKNMQDRIENSNAMSYYRSDTELQVIHS